VPVPGRIAGAAFAAMCANALNYPAPGNIVNNQAVEAMTAPGRDIRQQSCRNNYLPRAFLQLSQWWRLK
jgi:hypothetical protein